MGCRPRLLQQAWTVTTLWMVLATMCTARGDSKTICCENAPRKWWWSQSKASTVCTAATWPDQRCQKAVTFSQASGACTNAGARLCTLDELKNGKASRRLKCGLRRRHVWTSTACTDNGQQGYFSALGQSGAKSACEVGTGTALAGMVCCADTCQDSTPAPTPDPTTGAPFSGDPPLLPVFEEMNRLMQKREGESYLAEDYVIHDPSRAIPFGDDALMIAVTGKERAFGYNCGLETWVMNRGEDYEWKPAQCIMQQAPKWIKQKLGRANKGTFWAPAMIDERTMLYSVTNFAERANTCIGLLTASGESPANLKWKDHGAPLTCTMKVREEGKVPQPSSIDPAFFVDPKTGTRYLLYGGGHIFITLLDQLVENAGKKDLWWSKTSTSHTLLANGPNEPEDPVWIEAPYMTYHDDYYYLMLNWHGCCEGKDSTYEIRMGRSTSPTGPFVDKKGAKLTEGGGSMLLSGENTRKYDGCTGPGHAGILDLPNDSTKQAFTFHCYDMDSKPWSFIYSRDLTWGKDGWPILGTKPFGFAQYWS